MNYKRMKHGQMQRIIVIPLPVAPLYYIWRFLCWSVKQPFPKTLPGAVEWMDTTPSDRDCDYVAGLIFDHLNEFRALHGVAPVQHHDRLRNSAWNHSNRMKASGEFQHTLSDGVDLSARARRAGYVYQAVGENIGLVEASHMSLEEFAWQLHDGWVNSAGHRENLLRPEFTEVGIGVVRSGCRYTATQHFGRPLRARRSQPPPSATRNFAHRAHL